MSDPGLNATTVNGISQFFINVEQDISAVTGLDNTMADLLLAAVIITFGISLAIVVKYLLSHVLPRLVPGTRTMLDDELIKSANGPLQVFIIALSAYFAVSSLNDLSKDVYESLNVLAIIAVIYIFAYLLSNITGAVARWYSKEMSMKTSSELDDMLIPFLSKFVTVALFIIATLVVLSLLHVEVTPLVASLGLVGVALALAAEDFLANFLGAVSIFADKPYKIGDRVEMADGLPGDVLEIGVRSTRLRTLDNKTIIVPNAMIVNSRIINFAIPDPKVRFSLSVGIGYGSDVKKAKEIILDIASQVEGIAKDPAPQVYVTSLGDFSVGLTIYVWLEKYKYEFQVPDTIYKQILTRFKAEGIDIPFPVKTVILRGKGMPALENSIAPAIREKQ